MPTIESVGIISKPRSELAARIVPELIAWLEQRRIRVRLDEETASYAHRSDGIQRTEVPRGAQLLIVLGGDGTLLSAARAAAGLNIPLFAVNLGGLGFLTGITVDDLYSQLERALAGDFRLEQRRMLHAELHRGGQKVDCFDALNDVVLAKFEIARMIDLELQIDGHFVCIYRADGLIIASPTGSTAYSLSAGGPIVFPTVSAVLITPICPHTLTLRPVVVSDSSVIEAVNLSEDSSAYLTIDGQVGELLKRGDRVVCTRSQYCISLIQPPTMKFFDVLREKLKWGGR
jgi:NAD+ kinase